MIQFKNLQVLDFINSSDDILSWKAYWYCKDIKDRPEIRKNITDSFWAYYYCKDIKDCPDVRKNITKSYNAYYYCRDVKDRPEVRKLITDPAWKQKYLNWKKKNVTV